MNRRKSEDEAKYIIEVDHSIMSEKESGDEDEQESLDQFGLPIVGSNK